MFKPDILASANADYQHTALSLALASELAYEREENVIKQMKKWGFPNCEFYNEQSSQAFLAWNDQTVILAFCGSNELTDWLRNIKLNATPGVAGEVHRGFQIALDQIFAPISVQLGQIAQGKTIWLTGHSLGGAMATLAAAQLHENVTIDGIYTFGQPKTGNSTFKDWFEYEFTNRYYRFVNNRDLITRIPPNFTHIDNLYWFNSAGILDNNPPMMVEALPQPKQETPETYNENEAESTVHYKHHLGDLNPSQFAQFQAELNKITKAHNQPVTEEGTLFANHRSALDVSVEGFIPFIADHQIKRYIKNLGKMISYSPSETFNADIFASPSFVGNESLLGSANEIETITALIQVDQSSWMPTSDHVEVRSRISTIISIHTDREGLSSLENDQHVLMIEASRKGGVEEATSATPIEIELDAETDEDISGSGQGASTNPVAFINADQIHTQFDERGNQAIVAVIDSGIDILHNAFKDKNGDSRIIAVWDQQGTGRSPSQTDPAFLPNYGRLYTAQEIQHFVANPNTTPPQLRGAGHDHGTHVTSLAAGRPTGHFPGGVAPDAKIIFINSILRTDDQNPRSLGYSTSHVDAIAFIKTMADQHNLPVVINVSQGMNAGAHDGSSMLETAFDVFTQSGQNPGIAVVKSAGNERGHAGHAYVKIAPQAIDQITWNSSDTHRYHDYFEFWFNKYDEIAFTLIAPDGSSSSTISVNAGHTMKENINLGGNICRLTLTDDHPNNGDSRLVITIEESAQKIQPGIWTLQMEGLDMSTNEGVHGWIERNNNRPVRFVDGVDDNITLSIPGTANTVISIGACRTELPIRLGDFSSYGLTKDQRAKPNICAPGIDIVGAKGGETNHSATYPDSGTSMAAPHATGTIALIMSQLQKNPNRPQTNAQQIQTSLIQNTQNGAYFHHPGMGYGLLDALAVFKDLT